MTYLVCDNLIVWCKLPFIIYNLLELNLHPAPVTLDWDIPACEWALHCVCHKAMVITCRMTGNKMKGILRGCSVLIFCSAEARVDMNYG